MSAETPPTLLDRLWRNFRELVRAEFPRMTFLGSWTYVIQATDGVTADISAESSDVPLPSIVGVPLACSVAGENATPKVGSRCTVRFLNADPSQPEIVGGDYTQPPDLLKLGGGGPAAARVGDDVLCAYTVVTGAGSLDSIFSGTTAGLASATARAAALGGGAVVNTITGSISSGSSKVEIGP